MKLFNIKTLALATATASFLFAGSAMAQNVQTVPVNATVQNAITMTLNSPMDFGTIVAINNATQTASASMATTGVVTFATTGAPAFAQQASGTPAAASVGLAGITGATINIVLNNVVAPINGTDVFGIGTFLRDVNGAGSTATTPGTSYTYTATAADTILIGARLTTPTQAALIADGAYVGSFDLVASY